MNKINILPIIVDHFRTLRDARGRVLKRDIVLFFVSPLVIAIPASLSVRPSPPFVDFLLLANTLFIPLIVNVLFVIYGIKDRPIIREEEGAMAQKRARSQRLLDHLYKNLLYAVIMACISVVVLGFTKLFGVPPLGVLPQFVAAGLVAIRPAWEVGVLAVSYSLVIHTALTMLMIIKRTHALLADVVEWQSHSPSA